MVGFDVGGGKVGWVEMREDGNRETNSKRMKEGGMRMLEVVDMMAILYSMGVICSCEPAIEGRKERKEGSLLVLAVDRPVFTANTHFTD